MSRARELSAVPSRGGDVKAGTTAFFAMVTAPTGWLKANGAAVSRATYADLFDAIGTTFGSGDGSTTFNLPDLRGEFPRGWDDSRGVDSGRSLGTAQAQGLNDHKHELPFEVESSSGIATTDGGNEFGSGSSFTVGKRNGSVGNASGTGTWALTNTPYSSSVTGETRPRNVALLACIKF